MEINFLHKIEDTTNTSHLLWDRLTMKDMDILFHALSIVFMVETSQYLKIQAEERLVQLLSKSMVSKKFANLCKFGKEYGSDHCNLLFLHESSLQVCFMVKYFCKNMDYCQCFSQIVFGF